MEVWGFFFAKPSGSNTYKVPHLITQNSLIYFPGRRKAIAPQK